MKSEVGSKIITEFLALSPMSYAHKYCDKEVKKAKGVNLPVEAVITNRISTIEEIAKLKIGDTFIMDHHKDKDIIVRSGPISLFTGKIGKVDNKVAINLKNFFEE